MRPHTIGTPLLVLLLALTGTTHADAPAGRLQIPDGACEQLPVTAAPAGTADPLPPQAEAQTAAVDSVRRILDKGTTNKQAQVKRVLAKQRPVLFTLPQPAPGKIVGDLWVPSDAAPPPGAPGRVRCGNAVVVVGYDDARYGGAFELVQDCGATSYAESAFWMRYADFDALCQCAVELIATDNPKPRPPDSAPASVPVEPSTTGADQAGKRGSTASRATGGDVSARVQFQDAAGTPMPAAWTGQTYRMQHAYPSGTRFRITVTSTPELYVYALGADAYAPDRIVAVFPPAGAPHRAQSIVAVPDAGGFLQMDDVRGTDYICVLLSPQPLDIAPLVGQLAAGEGDLPSRLRRVLGPGELVAAGDAAEPGAIVISGDLRQVVRVIVEIPHA